MKYETIIQLLEEYDYKKNTKGDTIHFLIMMLNELVNGDDKDECN